MLIAIFGESCTGKSTLAAALKDRIPSELYSGRDYLRLEKSEHEAERAFKKILSDSVSSDKNVIYVITEKEHLRLLPEGCTRILTSANIETVKERFKKRMNGNLPAPVAAMLERKHGMFNDISHDISVNTDTTVDIDSVIEKINGLTQ